MNRKNDTKWRSPLVFPLPATALDLEGAGNRLRLIVAQEGVGVHAVVVFELQLEGDRGGGGFGAEERGLLPGVLGVKDGQLPGAASLFEVDSDLVVRPALFP